MMNLCVEQRKKGISAGSEVAMSEVVLDLEAFSEAVQDKADDLAMSSYDAQERKKARGLTRAKVVAAIRSYLGDIPEIGAYLRAAPGRGKSSAALYKKLSDYWKSLPQEDPEKYKVFTLLLSMADVHDVESARTREDFEKEAQEWADVFVTGTRRNAEVLQKLIIQAIKRVRDWRGEAIRVRPMYDGEYREGPIESFDVRLGRQAGFTIFTDSGKVQSVDDVLDAGDTDFFRDPHLQMNYFDLVRELERPGSTQKFGKNLKLWTARPTKDRHLYQDAKHVPTNIYLTTDRHRASGIAHDLGAGEIRDLWRITVNEKYLMKTLEAGHVKDYQTVGKRVVPVVRTMLVVQGEGVMTIYGNTLRILQELRECFGESILDADAPWDGDVEDWYEHFADKLGIDLTEEETAKNTKEVLQWVKEKFGAAKALAHREFLKQVLKDPAAHRRKMRQDRKYHQRHKWHDALMRKTRKVGWIRRHIKVKSENLEERDPGQAFMDLPFELRTTEGDGDPLSDVDRAKAAAAASEKAGMKIPTHYLKSCSMDAFYKNVHYFYRVKGQEWEGSKQAKLQRAIAASYSTLKQACGVTAKGRMTPSQIVKAGGV